jgi:hypothetical protein
MLGSVQHHQCSHCCVRYVHASRLDRSLCLQQGSFASVHNFCRKLKSVEETDAEWKNAVESFTGGDAAEAGILSLTFARQKQDLSESQISGFVKLLKHLEEIKLVSDGAGTVSIVHMCFTCCCTESVECFNTHWSFSNWVCISHAQSDAIWNVQFMQQYQQNVCCISCKDYFTTSALHLLLLSYYVDITPKQDY